MALVSSPVGAKSSAAKADYDNLRDDVIDHPHDGDETTRVDHTDLYNIGEYTHSEIDDHISADKAVHGGADNTEYVLLTRGSQKIIRKRTLEIPSTATGQDPTLQYEDYSFLNTGEVAFGGTPVVILRQKGGPTGPFGGIMMTSNITTTGFRVYFYRHRGSGDTRGSITVLSIGDPP